MISPLDLSSRFALLQGAEASRIAAALRPDEAPSADAGPAEAGRSGAAAAALADIEGPRDGAPAPPAAPANPGALLAGLRPPGEPHGAGHPSRAATPDPPSGAGGRSFLEPGRAPSTAPETGSQASGIEPPPASARTGSAEGRAAPAAEPGDARRVAATAVARPAAPSAPSRPDRTALLPGSTSPGTAGVSLPAAAAPRPNVSTRSTGGQPVGTRRDALAATTVPPPQGGRRNGSASPTSLVRVDRAAQVDAVPDRRVPEPGGAMPQQPSRQTGGAALGRSTPDAAGRPVDAGRHVDDAPADRTTALAEALTALAGADWSGGSGGILPSAVFNAAMIPGWPPPRPFEAPPAAVRRVAVPDAEVLLRRVAERGGPALADKLRTAMRGAPRRRRRAVLRAIAAAMDVIEALLDAVEQDLLLLSRGGTVEADADAAEVLSHRLLTA